MLVRRRVHHRNKARLVGALTLPAHLAREVLQEVQEVQAVSQTNRADQLVGCLPSRRWAAGDSDAWWVSDGRDGRCAPS